MFLRLSLNEEIVSITECNEKNITDHSILKMDETTLGNHIIPIGKPDRCGKLHYQHEKISYGYIWTSPRLVWSNAHV